MGDRARPILTHADVHVWVARPGELPQATLARCLAVLGEDEREHVARFRFQHLRDEAAVTRALVRSMLSEYAQRPPESFRYARGAYGKPFLAPSCGLFFNATNHPDLVACAVSRCGDIGVDIEPLGRGEEILEVAATVFSRPELEALAALPEGVRADRAVSLWTCKEAYIKATGLGFSAELRELAIVFDAGERPAVRVLSPSSSRPAGATREEPERWWIETRDMSGFRLAIAVRTPALEVTLAVSAVNPAAWPLAL